MMSRKTSVGALAPVPGGTATLAPAGRLQPIWVLAGVAMVVAGLAGLVLGPAKLPPLGRCWKWPTRCRA